MPLYRVDYGTLGEIERTPQGGLRVPAFLTRTGVFEYTGPDGSPIKEYRPPDEVFKADSMAMLKGSPLALDHPPETVRPDNFRNYAVGHVGEDVRKESDKIGATLYVQDASAIRAIEAGRREISCGYHVDVDETPGITPDGLPYDRVQRNIKYNHVALVPDGRAGHDVRLRLDAAGNSVGGQPLQRDEMEKERIDGVTYEVGTDAHRAACERRDAAEKSRAAEVEKLRADRDGASARADAAEEKLKATIDRVQKTFTPERIDQAVAARAKVVAKAAAVLGPQFKADGKTNAQIRAEAVAKAFPGIRLDGRSADYVKGLWQAIPDGATPAAGDRRDSRPPREDLARFPGTPRTDDRAHARTLEQVRQDAADMQANRAHQPLAMSRRDRNKPLSAHPALQGAQMEIMK